MNNRSLYQLFLRPFTPEGTLTAAKSKLRLSSRDCDLSTADGKSAFSAKGYGFAVLTFNE